MSLRRTGLCSYVCVFTVIAFPAVSGAVIQNYDGGSGDWNTTALNWDGGGTWTQGNTAVFGGTPGVVTLTEDISVDGSTAGVDFTVSGYTVDVGANSLIWDLTSSTSNIVVPGGTTVLLDGGTFGKPAGTTAFGSTFIVQSGGTISGTGLLSNGRGDFTLQSGGTLDVGAGTLSVNMPFGQTASLQGAIVGDGVSSVLNFGRGQPSGQLKGLTGGPNLTIQGVTEIQAHIINASPNMSFGRFSNPDTADLKQTTISLSGSETTDFQFEAQTTLSDFPSFFETVSVIPTDDIAFKLGELEHQGNADTRLVDTGAVADDFAFIGQLTGLGSGRELDLNDIPLLSDMSQAALQALVTSGGIINTGSAGAPTVKELLLGGDFTGGTGLFYVAPATIDLPLLVAQQVPEPSTGLLVMGGIALLTRRRRRDRSSPGA